MKKVRVFQDAKQQQRLGARKCPWSIEWRENGRRRSQSVGTKEEAEEARIRKVMELRDKAHGVVATKLWADFAAEYDRFVVETFPSPRSREATRAALRLFTETIKPKLVHPIDRACLDRYVASRLKMPGKKPGDTLSAETVKKELRHIRAALNTAAEWNYIRAVPKMPRVRGIAKDKRFMTEEHFDALMRACDKARMPDPRIHPGIDPPTWWRGLLAMAWVTGMRIGALLALRWEDVDLDRRVVWSRGKDNKAKRDMPHDIGVAEEFLRELPADDPRVFPWNHYRTTLYTIFHELQREAGIDLPCAESHDHTPACHAYGFHDVRRAHATYNYGKVTDRALQQQMGHASFHTTQRYVKYAELHQTDAYEAHLPLSLRDGQSGAQERETSGSGDGKPPLRVVGA